jgi:esterase/lipase superfamily enzyme
LALLSRKKRIACLGHSRGKDVLAADINALAGGAAELLV